MAGFKVIPQNKLDSNLDNLYIHGIQAFLALLHFECHLVVLTDLINQSAYVNEDVGRAVVRLNETKSFGFIEKFYCSFLHCNEIKNDNEERR